MCVCVFVFVYISLLTIRLASVKMHVCVCGLFFYLILYVMSTLCLFPTDIATTHTLHVLCTYGLQIDTYLGRVFSIYFATLWFHFGTIIIPIYKRHSIPSKMLTDEKNNIVIMKYTLNRAK